jgi:hypothetical protein
MELPPKNLTESLARLKQQKRREEIALQLLCELIRSGKARDLMRFEDSQRMVTLAFVMADDFILRADDAKRS